LRTWAKRWGGIFKSYGFQTIMDVGSTVDGTMGRGIVGLVTASLKPEIDGLKENPASETAYPIEMIVGLQRGYSEQNIVEFTYNPSENQSANIARIYGEIVRAKNAGSKRINLSFMSNYHETGSVQYAVGHGVMQQLATNGWLGQRRVFGSSSCAVLNFSADAARTGGGYMGAYGAAYEAAMEDCEGEGYPTVVVVDDLGSGSV
jgi:hypothetical protein